MYDRGALMIAIALDFDSRKKALDMVRLLKPYVDCFKVGLELFSNCGMDIVKNIHSLGSKVFLDLKYFDIPNTVTSASKVAIENGVFMYDVHALGGYDFLRRVSDFNAEYADKLNRKRPLLIGVTVLTSMDAADLTSVGILESVESEVLRLAEVCRKAGLDGVVCSVNEVRRVKNELGKDFLTVTPGIRLNKSNRNDQKRVFTPVEAINEGADLMVIGRTVTKSRNPEQTIKQITDDIRRVGEGYL
jgi:orotidine-5'-phosphate decarboxylase